MNDKEWNEAMRSLRAWQERQPGYWLLKHTRPWWVPLYRLLLRVAYSKWRWRWHFRLQRWGYPIRRALGLSVAQHHPAGRDEPWWR